MKKILIIMLAAGFVLAPIKADREDKRERKADKKQEKREKKGKLGAIPTGLDEAALDSFLKEKRSDKIKKKKGADDWYTMLLANTSTQPITVVFKNGWTVKDVAVTTAVGVVTGPVGGAVAAGAIGTDRSKKHEQVIAPGTYQIFHRPKAVQHIRFVLRPANASQECSKKIKRMSMNVSDKRNILIVSAVSSDGCSIESFRAMKAGNINGKKITPEKTLNSVSKKVKSTLKKDTAEESVMTEQNTTQEEYTPTENEDDIQGDIEFDDAE